MPSDVKYNKSSGLIESTFSGELTASEVRESVRRRIALQEETGAVGVLADASEVQASPSIIDLFALPTALFSEEGAKRDTKIALVVPRSHRFRETADFLEMASRNRGWLIQVFEDRQSAAAWLMKHTAPSKPTEGG